MSPAQSSRAPSLAERVLRYIRDRELMKPGDRVGVAVSGGADSVALLRLLLELRQELGVVLSVVHLNHQLRGAESDEDERFVAALAQQYQLQWFARSADVRAYAEEKQWGLEAAGRSLRYQHFRDVADKEKLDCVATAHTSDDQAETVLLKLLRGAWTRGLAGIYPNQPLSLGSSRLVRPLLSESRADLRVYLQTLQQPWREDASNQDCSFARNRVRHELLPLLERDFNPNLTEVLGGTAELARAEEEYWSARVEQLLQTVTGCAERKEEELGYEVRFCVERFRELDLAEQRRLVTRILEGMTSVAFKNVEATRMALLNGSKVVLPGGLEIRVANGLLQVRLPGEAP